MYQQPNLIGTQQMQPTFNQLPSAFLPPLERARSAGQVEEYRYQSIKPKKQLKELRKVLLPEKKKFLIFKYGKKFDIKDRCIICGTQHVWDAGDALRPPIPLTEVTKGRPMRGTYCPRHASHFKQHEMLEEKIMAEKHGLEFNAYKPRIPKVLKSGPVNNLTKADVTSLMALGWYIVPPAQEKETPNDEAYRLITEINLATERLNYLVGNTGVEVADPTASKPIEKVSENAD